MKASFIASEIAIGLRRNLTMTIAGIVTMTVSLVFVGFGLLARTEVNLVRTYFYAQVEATIYLCGPSSTAPVCDGKTVTQEERIALQKDLTALPQVASVHYETSQEAYERFKKLFRDSKELVNNVRPDALPESFRVKLKDPNQFDVVESAFQDRPGVEEVTDVKKLLDPVFRLLNAMQKTALIVALIELAAAALLISNTIRVAAFSRRRETGIMRLVGASNLYIQLPFLLEGALAGLVGGLLASGMLAAGKHFLIDGVLSSSIKFLPFVAWSDVYATMPLLIVLGVALSSLASLLTLRRHLRV